MPELTPIEVRVLGALVEKAMATPEYYPLTLNSLTLACNQTSNRDPVVSYDEGMVSRALDSLRDKKLAYLHGGGSGRVPRFGHRLADVYPMDHAELAVMCVLLLRGPQTVGEIKGRAARLHEFASLAEAEEVLSSLAARDNPPLVRQLEREPGHKERRYVQLLGTPPDPAVPGQAERVPDDPGQAAAAPADLEAVRHELTQLKEELAELKAQFAEFRRQFE